MFDIRVHNIDAATENLLGQIGGWRAILNETNDCLSEIRDMSSLWQEVRQLSRCVELIKEEINGLQNFTEGLVNIKIRYERSDETGADYAETILRKYKVNTFSEVNVPVYEDGIIDLQ